MISAFRAGLLAAAVLLPAAPALAEEADDAPAIVVTGHRDDDTVSSTKTGTPLRDTPQAVAVLDREQLNDRGVEQLNDALRYVPGVVLGQGEGHRDQITLRGQNTTADFFLDGVRDDAQYYRPLYNTERVEVLKGANALLFGRGGGGGVINRVSKAPAFDSARYGVSLSGDSFGAWSAATDLGVPLGEAIALRLNATYEELANHRDQFGGHFTGVAPTLGARLGEATTFVLAYEYAEDRRTTDRGIPSFAGLPLAGFEQTFFGDAAINRSEVTAHFARFRIDHELADGLTLNAIGQYAEYDKYYGNVLPGAVNPARTTVALSGYRSSTSRENWIGQVNLVWKGETGPLAHTLLAGIEAADQATLASRDDLRFGGSASVTVPLALRITVPASTYVPTSASRTGVRGLSAYLQDQIEIGEHVELLIGARFDDFRIEATDLRTNAATSRSDGKWSPRAALIVKPVHRLSLYASYARSFLPQTGDQFTTLPANLTTLAPEEFRSLEAGIKWDLAHGLTLTAAAFRLDRSNTRANDPLTGSLVLTGSSRVEGIEASLAGRIIPRWQLNLGYALQDGKVRTTTTAAPAGRRLAQLPRHQFSAWTRYGVTDSIGLALGLVHQSSQFATVSNAVRLPAFTRIDAALFFEVTDAFSVQINVENLAYTRYFPAAHSDTNVFTGEPLNARITARLKF